MNMFISHFLAAVLFLSTSTDRLHVTLQTDEAHAVLSILAEREAGKPVADSDWQQLFDSEGYRRLKKRELSMNRPFDDEDFRNFVLSPELLKKAAGLRRTLASWKQADINKPAAMALAYLPLQAEIRARIYPVIKPASNSFVFEVKSDPAIFLYLNPEVSEEKFENTVAHELHHIGYGSACPAKEMHQALEQQPANVREMVQWIGAFGEGFAMLAAAGGPDVHPHAVSPAEDRQRWDHDMADFAKNQQELDGFFRRILSGKPTNEQADKQAFSYFGIQGPWYTVGYKMAVTIEKTYGRPRLIQAMCNPATLLSTYNAAVKESSGRGNELLPLWSPEIIAALKPLQDK